MKGFLFPDIRKADFGFIIGCALIGAIFAGLFGVLHDQVTYSISPEYFTKIKFKQFHYADIGLGNRFFVATIGFLATWWVGFFIGWFLSRTVLHVEDKTFRAKKVKLGFGIVFATTLIISFAVAVYGFIATEIYGHQRWMSTFDYYNIKDTHAFMRVVFIHYASYLGGVIGLIVAFLVLSFNKPGQ